MTKNTKLLYWIAGIISIFILFDLSATFIEFYRQALMGDIVPLILPDERNAPILSNPFGIQALWNGEYHPNINRFFCSISLFSFFRSIPFILQLFVNPVESLYLSSSLFKFGVYLSFIILFIKYICFDKFSWIRVVLATFILLPFMQIGGKLNFISLIDNSIVYVFFYGFPVSVLLLFIYPFYKLNRSKKGSFKLSKPKMILLGLLLICLSFSSAVMPPVILISGGLYLLDWLFRNKNNFFRISSPKDLITWDIVLVILALILNFYSLILGMFNPESIVHKPLAERYLLLWKGIQYMFLEDGSYLMVWATTLISYLIAKWQKIKIWDGKFDKLFLYALLFILVYLLLLPLGGFRPYRPLIVRNDTAIPLNVISILLCGVLVYELILNLIPRLKIPYLALFMVPLIYGTHFDFKDHAVGKVCEQEALYKMYHAPKETEVIVIEELCNVTSWVAVRDSSFYENHAIMWQYWNISDHKVLLSFTKADW